MVLDALFYRLRNAGPWRTIYGWYRRWMLGVRWITALTLIATAGALVASIRTSPVDAALEMEAVIRLSADPFPASP